jgi:lysozyme
MTLKKWEDLRLVGYICPAGKPTWGFGHTGKEVVVGKSITMEAANYLLKQDVAYFEKWMVEHCRKMNFKPTQSEFDGLVSFVFNCGENNFLSYRCSWLIKPIAGETALKKAQRLNLFIESWKSVNKARVNGVLTTLKGLADRRVDEILLYQNIPSPIKPRKESNEEYYKLIKKY